MKLILSPTQTIQSNQKVKILHLTEIIEWTFETNGLSGQLNKNKMKPNTPFPEGADRDLSRITAFCKHITFSLVATKSYCKLYEHIHSLIPLWLCYLRKPHYSVCSVDGTVGSTMRLCSQALLAPPRTAKYHVGDYEDHLCSKSRNHFMMAGHNSNL